LTTLEDLTLTSSLEPWPGFAKDPYLKTLFLAYGEEYDCVCDPDWPLAHRLWMTGDLHAIALRADRILVGFCICRIEARLAFRGKRLAIADSLYVDPEYRAEGSRLLIETACGCMREKGAHSFALHHGLTADSAGAPAGFKTAMRVWFRELLNAGGF
jgi:GNAT superfamily N-acetyltransferase